MRRSVSRSLHLGFDRGGEPLRGEHLQVLIGDREHHQLARVLERELGGVEDRVAASRARDRRRIPERPLEPEPRVEEVERTDHRRHVAAADGAAEAERVEVDLPGRLAHRGVGAGQQLAAIGGADRAGAAHVLGGEERSEVVVETARDGVVEREAEGLAGRPFGWHSAREDRGRRSRENASERAGGWLRRPRRCGEHAEQRSRQRREELQPASCRGHDLSILHCGRRRGGSAGRSVYPAPPGLGRAALH